MPKVGKEYYGYDTKGKAAAKQARIALAKKKKKKKKTPKKRSA
mgnify:FL=1